MLEGFGAVSILVLGARSNVEVGLACLHRVRSLQVEKLRDRIVRQGQYAGRLLGWLLASHDAKSGSVIYVTLRLDLCATQSDTATPSAFTAPSKNVRSRGS